MTPNNTGTDSSDAPQLYYLVRRGTNARVVSKDNEPVIIEEPFLLEQQDRYEQIVRDELVPILVQEWVERYWAPLHRAKQDWYTRMRQDAAAAATATPPAEEAP